MQHPWARVSHAAALAASGDADAAAAVLASALQTFHVADKSEVCRTNCVLVPKPCNPVHKLSYPCSDGHCCTAGQLFSSCCHHTPFAEH